MTRPRMAGSAAIWTVVFALMLVVRPIMPIGTSRIAKSQTDGAMDAMISNRPNTVPATTSIRSREERRRAASRAPAREPAAMRMLKYEYIPAPPWKISSAKAVSQIGKLNPNVPTKPTRTMGQISSGRPET